MPTKLVVLPEAIAEARAAFQWYFERNPAVAQRFEDAVDHAMALITERPHAWPPDDVSADTRRFVLQRFPYSVIYRVEVQDGASEVVTVVAVAHQRRRSGYWRGR